MFLNFTDTFASPPGPLIDDRTGCPWEVPTYGELLLTFQSTAMPPSADAVATDDTIKILTTTATKHVSKNEKQQQQSPSPPPHEQKQQRESIT